MSASTGQQRVCYAYYEDLLAVEGFDVLSVCPVCERRVGEHPHNIMSEPMPVPPSLTPVMSQASSTAIRKLDVLSEELNSFAEKFRDFEKSYNAGDFVITKNALIQYIAYLEAFQDKKVKKCCIV
jgi:hypothetical protein